MSSSYDITERSGFIRWIINLINLFLPIIHLTLNLLWLGYTKIQEPPQNSSRRKGDMKVVHNEDT